MAAVTTAVTIPLWIGTGVHGAVALALSIALFLKTTTHRTRFIVKDSVMQNVLILAFAAEVINAMGYLAQALGQQIYSRFDTVDVNWMPVLVSCFTYPIVTKLLTTYLCHNSGWNHYLWLGTLFGTGNLLLSTFIGDLSRYVELAFGWFTFIWVMHALRVYRRRFPDALTIFVTIWVVVCWNAGFILPILLGHANLQSLTYLQETWWLTMFSFANLTLPAVIVVLTLYKTGPRSGLASGRMFATRCADGMFILDRSDVILMGLSSWLPRRLHQRIHGARDDCQGEDVVRV